MTNDYKRDILDYITNNVTVSSGTNEPQFQTYTTLTANVYTDIGTELASENVDIYQVLGQLYDETSQDLLFYGYYRDTDSNYYGYIYLVDEDLKKVQMITTFTSGNKLFPIVVMNQDENGYMYAISKMFDDTGTARVLLFNNIFGKLGDNYIAKLRASYIIPGGNNYDFGMFYNNKITKVPGEATYYMLARPGQENYTIVIEFINNVGMENEWNTYYLDELYSLSMCSTLIEKENDTVKYYMYFVSQTGNPSNYVEYVLTNGHLSKTKTISLGVLATYSCTQVLAKNRNEIYISYYTASDKTNYIYKVVGNGLQQIYTFTAGGQNYATKIVLEYENNIMFVKRIYENGANYRYCIMGIMQDDVIYWSVNYSFTRQGSFWNYVLIPTIVTYNLVKYYATDQSGSKRVTMEYNPLNYNGLAYDGYSQTLPSKARLYSNSKLVFARNLYNTTLLGAIATSTVQVPNTLLNSTVIDTNNLVGTTNTVLVSDSTSISKNVYETLYINFIRTLGVEDEDTDTVYPLAASYINQNINNPSEQNCNDSFIGKVRINYTNSTVMQNINWSYSTDHYETEFVIDATQEVPTLDFMSNDETTVYITKELDINTGNYYKVVQKLRIE